MYANGFLAEKRRSPVSLAAVIGLHATALGAVMLFGTTTFTAHEDPPTKVFNVPIEPPPPPVPQPRPEPEARRQVSTPTVTPPVTPPATSTIVAPVTPPVVYQPPVTPLPQRPVMITDATPVIPPPVRRAAEVDPRYRDALQPPYPRERERLQQEGRVRVRVTIGTDGRVTAIEQLSSTQEDFWRVTERQARTRWRFRPATVDGRPVVSTMMMTVTFRLPEA